MIKENRAREGGPKRKEGFERKREKLITQALQL